MLCVNNMSRFPQPVRDRRRILTDTAVSFAYGGTVFSDLATLRDQSELFGPVASDPPRTRHCGGALSRARTASGFYDTPTCHRDQLLTLDLRWKLRPGRWTGTVRGRG